MEQPKKSDYTKNVYNALKSKVDGFNKTEQEFRAELQSNPNYVINVHNALSSKVDGFKKDINSFKALVGIESPKKKSTSTSTSAPQKSASAPQAGSSGIIEKNNQQARNIPKGTKFRLPNDTEVEKSNASAVKTNKPGDISLVTAKQVGSKPKTKQEIDKQISDSYSMDENQMIKKSPENDFSKFADFNTSSENKAILKSALQKHDQATTVDENFINETVAEAEEIAGGNNTWENVKSSVKGAFNSFLGQNIGLTMVAQKLGVNPYQNTDPLAEEKTKARKKLIDSGVEPKKINEADVLNEAKKIYAENKIKDKKLSLSNDFYENLSDSEKDALELKFTYDKSKLTDEDNRLIQNLKITKARIKDLTFDAEPILAKIKNKEKISPEEFKIIEELDKQINIQSDIYDDYQSNSKSLLSAEEELDLVKREYGEVQNFVADVGTAGLKIGLGALQTAKTALIDYNPVVNVINEFSKLNNGTEEAGGIIDEISNNLNLGLGKAQSELDKWNQNTFRKNTENFNSVNDGINFVTDLIGNQAPNIALMIATGGGSALATRVGVSGNQLALGSIGAYSYGNKKNEMIGSNNSEDLNNRTYYSNTQIELASILYGGSEMFETATLGALGKTKRFIGASLAEAPTRELFRKSIKDNIISVLKSNSKDVLEENIEEQVTNLIQNYTERNVLGKNDVGLFDNAGEVLKSSTAMALLLKAPQFAGAVAKKFQPKQYNEILDKNAAEVLSLMEELKKEGLSKQTQDVISAQIGKLSQESDAIVKKTFERIGKLPSEQVDKVVELEKSTSELRAKAEAINNDEALSKETKEKLIKDLSSQYKTQEDLRTKIVSEKATILHILPENEVTELKKKAVQNLLVESAGKNEANFTEELIDQKAIELYNQSNNKKTEVNLPLSSSETQVNTSNIEVNLPNNETTNEAAPSQDIANDGNIRPSDAVVDQNESANKGDNQNSVQQSTNLQGNNGQEIVLNDVANFLNEQFGADMYGIESKEIKNPVVSEPKFNTWGTTNGYKKLNNEDSSLPEPQDPRFQGKRITEPRIESSEGVIKVTLPISDDFGRSGGAIISFKNTTGKTEQEILDAVNEVDSSKYDKLTNTEYIQAVENKIKELSKNETTPSQDINDNGNIRPSDAVVDQDGSANKGDNGQEIGNDNYKSGKNQIVGRTRTITIADGSKLEGTYKVVSSDDVIASHKESNFSKSDNYPLNERGETINDRNYENDTNAQEEVVKISQSYDGRAIQQTPVITKDGIVIDGNNRVMSRKLSAQKKTDAIYLQELENNADMYGIDSKEIKNIKNPVLIFEPTNTIPYTTETLAKFNKQDKKEKSSTAKAVEFSKTLSEKSKRQISEVYEQVDTPSEVTTTPKIAKKMLDILLNNNIIQSNEIPRYFSTDKGVFTKEGTILLENIALGSVLNEKTIDALNLPNMGNVRKKVLANLVGLLKNSSLGSDYTLSTEIANAIEIMYKLINQKVTIEQYLSEPDFFGEKLIPTKDEYAVLLVFSKGEREIKKWLSNYNEQVGKLDMFKDSDNQTTNKQDITDETIRNQKGQIPANLRSNESKPKEGIKPENKDFGEEKNRIEEVAAEVDDVLANEEKIYSVRDLAEMQEGELSASVFSSLEKSDVFKVGNKTYEVTTKSKGKVITEFENKKGKKVTYTKDRITIKERKPDGTLGKPISGNLIRYSNGNTSFSGEGAWSNLSRDIDGDITTDLINENNPLHNKSDSYNLAKKTINNINKQQRKELANAEVDRIADKVKALLPSIKDPNLKNQGFSQDQLIDLIASAVKNLVSAGIDINEAIKQVVDSVKAKFGDIDIDIEAVKERVSPKQKVTQQPIINTPPKQQNKKPIDKESIEKDSFEDMAGKMPNSGIVGEFLSGKTTEKTTGNAPEGNQEYDKIKLIEAFAHGKNIINKAIEQFGDNYVASILDYIENYQLNPENIALAYISLENHLRDMVKMNPTDITIKKQFDLVQSKRQNYAKSVAQAMNMAKLQNMAYYGYDLSETVELIFTESQLETKRKIERAIQASADDINNEAEFQENEAENDIEEITIKAPKRKRNANVVKKELDDVWKNMLNDIAKSTKDGSLQTALPYQKQIIAATPHILKATQLLAELGTLSSKQIIDEIYNKLKTSFPDIERSDVVNIIKNENNKPKTISKIVKKALIDAGFGREINITKKDENGNKVKEKRDVLDWKKLAGEEGSIDNIKKNVEETLKKQGYFDEDIKDIQADLEAEYTNLRASIIEKSLNELERRNTPKNVNAKTHAQRLAELYNYGLFESNASEYDNLLNGLLGMNDFDIKTYEQLKQRGKALAELYGTDLDPLFISTKIDELQKQINDIVYKFVFKNGGNTFRVVSIISEYMNLAQRMMLHSLGQIVQNPFSGATQIALTKVGNTFNKNSNKELRKQRNKVALNILNDITGNAALSYGNVESNFSSHSKIEDIINSRSENKVYHRVITSLLGKMHLEAADSYYKTLLTTRYFTNNLIKILTDKTNPNGAMSKQEALRYVTENLTGQSFSDAMVKARDIINDINEKAGKKLLSDKEESVVRFADGIVKASLLKGGKLTKEQIEASYKASYTSAGFDLGHEANNVISKQIGLYNAQLDRKIKDSVKEKKYGKASIYLLEGILTKNMLNAFIGGGTNWIVLTLQKAGLDYVSLVRDNVLSRSEKIDLSSDSGIKGLKETLIRNTNAKNTNTRMAIGAMVSISAFLLWYDDLDDEEKDKQIEPLKTWLAKNSYAKKYFNYISPTVLGLIISAENEELGKETGKILGIKSEIFNDGSKLVKAVSNLNKSISINGIENEDKYKKAKGDLGKLVGNKFSTPLPWRSVRDIENFYRGMNGLPEYKTNYKATSFTDGFFKGGMIEYIQSNPDKLEEEENE